MTSHNGVPHIWAGNNGKHDWYGYTPTDADLKALADSVNAYAEVYFDRSRPPKSLQEKLETAKSKVKESYTPKDRRGYNPKNHGRE